ncbi:hypothetical protein P4O66_000145 [Electrophorus voltai]|uniref:Alkylated DNA repair protein AlkB homologue 8 N-terminal domain-containing protein n=1 Tax=Electrophorus voltai TaxID=2609070 RepID=A0AAD8ZVY2_9TELE|nr:hypothetical protein P4O66_000145 [Electrophorus voltai]
MVVDFRRARRDHSPLAINGSSVEIVKNIKFLGVHIAENLTWTLNTSSITKRAQQRLYFLRKLREAHLPSPIVTTFYRGSAGEVRSHLRSCTYKYYGAVGGHPGSMALNIPPDVFRPLVDPMPHRMNAANALLTARDVETSLQLQLPGLVQNIPDEVLECRWLPVSLSNMYTEQTFSRPGCGSQRAQLSGETTHRSKELFGMPDDIIDKAKSNSYMSRDDGSGRSPQDHMSRIHFPLK